MKFQIQFIMETIEDWGFEFEQAMQHEQEQEQEQETDVREWAMELTQVMEEDWERQQGLEHEQEHESDNSEYNKEICGNCYHRSIIRKKDGHGVMIYLCRKTGRYKRRMMPACDDYERKIRGEAVEL